MKIKNYKIKKYTLLKLHLIKYQAYKINLKNFKFLNLINNLELSLKHVLNLIYLYHSCNKRILFVGFPYHKKLQNLNALRHIFIPKKCWIKGLFSNKNSKIQSTLKQATRFTIHPISKNDPDLVVLFNLSKTEQDILVELSTVGCPIIVIGNQIPINVSNKIYTVPGFLLKKNMKRLCFFLIHSILKVKKI